MLNFRVENIGIINKVVIMLPKKICKKINCNKLIDYNKKYCPEHEIEMIKKRKEKFKRYDEERKDSREWRFYRTKGWINKREKILTKYAGLDIYEFIVNDMIVYANTVHHITPLKEDWNSRLEDENLFPLSERNHKLIHIEYEKGEENKKEMQRKLIGIMMKWESFLIPPYPSNLETI